MKNEALEFAAYLETQLVPDFREAGMTPTADDFATAARFIRGLAADPAVAALVAAARAGLDYLQRTNPLEHGNPDLGRTWGALENALEPFNK